MRKRYAETLFTNYEIATLHNGGEVAFRKDGFVELITVGCCGDEVYTYLPVEEVERIAIVARCMREYFS